MAYVSFAVELDFTQIEPASCLLAETGGGNANGSISFSSADGRMFLGSSGTVNGITFANFLDVLKAKLDAVGNATYSVAFDQNAAAPRLVITATGGSVTSFAFTMANDAWKRLTGFWTDPSGSLTATASKQPWYWMRAHERFLSQWPLDYEDSEDIAKDSVSNDAVAYGVARESAPLLFDAVAPLEPTELVWDVYAEKSGTLETYTWQKFFKDARNTSLVAVKINGHGSTHPDSTRFVRLRQDGAAFKPQLRVEGYWDFVDIPFRGRTAKVVLDSEAPPPPTWTPANLGSSLKVWLQPTGIVNASGFASDWTDSSGNSYNFTQATAGFRPAVGTYASLPMIDADGTDDVLSRAFMSGILSGNYGVYLVFKADAASGTGASFYTNDGIVCDSNQYWGIYLRDASGTYQVALYHWDTAARTSVNTLSLGTWYWMESSYDGTNVQSRLGGVAGTTTAASTLNAGHGGSCFIARGSAGGFFSDVSVAEIIITNSVVSGADLTNLRAYITAKYGLTT